MKQLFMAALLLLLATACAKFNNSSNRINDEQFFRDVYKLYVNNEDFAITAFLGCQYQDKQSLCQAQLDGCIIVTAWCNAGYCQDWHERNQDWYELKLSME